MHVKPAKMGSKLFLLLDADVLEVLASEDDDASFCDQEGELVFLHVGQFGELEAFDLGSDARSQFRDFDFAVFGVQEMGLCLVGFRAAVDEFKWFRGRELGGLIVDWEIMIVFVLWDCQTQIAMRHCTAYRGMLRCVECTIELQLGNLVQCLLIGSFLGN